MCQCAEVCAVCVGVYACVWALCFVPAPLCMCVCVCVCRASAKMKDNELVSAVLCASLAAHLKDLASKAAKNRKASMRTQQEETVKHTHKHTHTETQGDTQSVAFSFRNGKLL